MKNLTRRDALITGGGFATYAACSGSLALALPARKPKRILFICSSLGFLNGNFYPKPGQDICSSRYLKPWADLKDDFSVFSGLSHDGLLGSLHRGEQCFLTAQPGAASFGFKNTISIDQLLKRQIGHQTRVGSLNMSLGDKGLCFNDAGTMLPPDTDDSALYDRLFRPATDAERRARRAQLNAQLQLLDSYAATAIDERALGDFFSTRDHLKESVNAELDWIDAAPPEVGETLPFPDARDPALMKRLRNFLINTRLAFATDSTRIAVLHMPFYNKVPEIMGIDTAWHRLTHSKGKNPGKQLAQIETLVMQEIGTFLKNMKATPAGKGTLLDETMVLIGSNMGNAANHDSRNLPIIVAGGGFDHGRYLQFDRENNTALSQVFLSLTQRMDGVALNTFKGTETCLPDFS